MTPSRVRGRRRRWRWRRRTGDILADATRHGLPRVLSRPGLHRLSEDLWLLGRGVVRGLGVGLEGLSERLGLCGRVLRAGRVAARERADGSRCRTKVGRENLDKVGWKGAD